MLVNACCGRSSIICDGQKAVLPYDLPPFQNQPKEVQACDKQKISVNEQNTHHTLSLSDFMVDEAEGGEG
jgi:hypothetical protein